MAAASPVPGATVASGVGRKGRWSAGPVGAGDVARWILLASWALVVVGAVSLGGRTSSLGQLVTALDSGEVQAVEVSPGLPPDASGSTTQTVQWREGLLRYRATVVMVTPDSQGQATSRNGIPVRNGFDIATDLRQTAPGVDIVRAGDLWSGSTIYGWWMPTWLGLLAAAGALGTLTLLVSGPAPWRATRWAWFWLISNPLGLTLFLVLSGPTPPLPAPRHPARRLTGGWAFLLSIALAWFLPTWWPPHQ